VLGVFATDTAHTTIKNNKHITSNNHEIEDNHIQLLVLFFVAPNSQARTELLMCGGSSETQFYDVFLSNVFRVIDYKCVLSYSTIVRKCTDLATFILQQQESVEVQCNNNSWSSGKPTRFTVDLEINRWRAMQQV
jgi:hypothetical protein